MTLYVNKIPNNNEMEMHAIQNQWSPIKNAKAFKTMCILLRSSVYQRLHRSRLQCSLNRLSRPRSFCRDLSCSNLSRRWSSLHHGRPCLYSSRKGLRESSRELRESRGNRESLCQLGLCLSFNLRWS